jgi:hypothetical protein
LGGLPGELVAAAKESMGAAVAISSQAPGGELVLAAAQDAFMSGFAAGSLVAGTGTAVGAVLALV